MGKVIQLIPNSGQIDAEWLMEQLWPEELLFTAELEQIAGPAHGLTPATIIDQGGQPVPDQPIPEILPPRLPFNPEYPDADKVPGKEDKVPDKKGPDSVPVSIPDIPGQMPDADLPVIPAKDIN